MPASPDPDLALRLAKAIADIYGDAAVHVLEAVTRRLARGITEAGWAEVKLLELASLRREIVAELDRLEAGARTAIVDAVTEAHTVGADLAVSELAELDITLPGIGVNRRAVEALAREAITAVQSTHLQILRSTSDAFRQVIAEAAAPQVVTGAMTRREAAQTALDRFADRGVTGFVDQAGRRWELESYTEMATRTAVGRAQVQGSLDRYQQAGRDLVIVSDAPEECRACRPWEGRVLSISGRTPGRPTLAQATAAGLLHANCRHALGLFVPGLTKPMTRTADPRGDEERQEQRRLERSVRHWRRRETVALDQRAATNARRRRQQAQERLSAFVDEHDRKRLRYRETIGRAR